MKPAKILAALALFPALVSLAADPAHAARRKPSKDAIVNETGTQAAPAQTAEAAAVPASPAPAAPQTEQQTPPAAQAPEPVTPYSASSAALAPPAEKPVVQTPIKQGKVEAGGSLTYAWTGEMTDTMTLRGRAGLFYTRELSLGVSFTTNMGGHDNLNALFFEPQYHLFVDPKLVPFVSGRIGGGRLGDGDKNHFSSFALGAGLGAKYFTRDDLFFYFQFDDIHYFADGGRASLSLGAGMAGLF